MDGFGERVNGAGAEVRSLVAEVWVAGETCFHPSEESYSAPRW